MMLRLGPPGSQKPQKRDLTCPQPPAKGSPISRLGSVRFVRHNRVFRTHRRCALVGSVGAGASLSARLGTLEIGGVKRSEAEELLKVDVEPARNAVEQQDHW